MDSFLLAMGTAVWLGFLTSISPCPLATNIAAITFIGKRISSPLGVFLSGLAYTLGRTLVYVGLAVLLIKSVFSIPGAAMFLQNHFPKALGPLLILTGIVLLGVIPLSFPGFGSGARTLALAEKGTLWGAALLGALFALAFCPTSAAFYFGSLIPLSLNHGSEVLLPALFGVGTALPVLVFAVAIAVGARAVAALFHRLTQFERWARRITGIVFILAGIYEMLRYNFGLFVG